MTNLPQAPITIIKDDLKQKVRVCLRCHQYISKLHRVRKIIKVFELSNLNLKDLFFIGKIDSEWKEASMFCIDKFKSLINNRLCTDDYTITEKKIIWMNRKYIENNGKWMIPLIKCIDYNNKKIIYEMELILDNYYGDMEKLSENDLLTLIRINKNVSIISNLIVKKMDVMDFKRIDLYLPFMICYLENNLFIMDFLIEKICDEYEMIVKLYLMIKVFCKNEELKMRSVKNLSSKVIKNKYKDEFINLVNMLEIDTDKILELTHKNITIPLFPNKTYIGIDKKNIQIMDSFSKPIVIPFIQKNNDIKNIMYKNDDIRKDYIILTIIEIIHKILKDEENMDIQTIRYKVLPTSINSGYIEYISNASTIFNIINKKNMSIHNFLSNNNPDSTVKNLRERFIKSTALYCMISYLLGFGDRHLDNIMISNDGLLFHIDFGYILGQDPKYSNNKSIRITNEIIEAMGGKDSDDYIKFRNYCATIYDRLRKHVNLFSNLLSIIPFIDSDISKEKVRDEIIDRFEVGETYKNAINHMKNKVDTPQNYTDILTDKIYHTGKTKIGKTMKNAMNDISQSVNDAKTFFSSIWN
jgi:hypothetical protein